MVRVKQLEGPLSADTCRSVRRDVAPDPDFNFPEHRVTQDQELGEEVLITGTSAGCGEEN